MNNIAEGWESLHVAEKRQAYNYARRSCGEVRSMLYVLLDNGFIQEEKFQDLMSLVTMAGRLISGLMRTLNSRGPN